MKINKPALLILSWVAAVACYDGYSLEAAHPCNACSPCETCEVDSAGTPVCVAETIEGYRCGNDNMVYSVSACDDEIGVFEDCGNNGECIALSENTAECTCRNHWEGYSCETCPSNWMANEDCAVCSNHWTGNDCSICPDHFDVQKDCAVCTGGWTGDDCDVCPDRWDSSTDCTSCVHGWTGPTCAVCPFQWNAADNCSTCADNWTGESCDIQVGCIRYVNGTSTSQNPSGLDWSDAFQSIQEGIESASAAVVDRGNGATCQVWVAKGVYTSFQESRLDSLQMAPDVHLFGGFVGTESELTQQDFTENETVISGVKDTDTVYTTVTGANGSILDGFTISGGRSDGPDTITIQSCGGGLFIPYQHGMTVRNCRFVDDYASQFGAGICNMADDTVVENCSFDTLMKNAFYHKGTRLWIRNSLFFHNLNLFGGALYFAGGSATVENSVFFDNLANMGGAVFMETTAITDMLTIANCTFVENVSDTAGSIYAQRNTYKVENSILTHSTESEGREIFNVDGSTADISYSLVSDGYPGVGNLDADPLFTDIESLDFSLQATSPCIDAANGDAAPQFDAAQNPRVDILSIVDTGIGIPTYADMGAYEYQNR